MTLLEATPHDPVGLAPRTDDPTAPITGSPHRSTPRWYRPAFAGLLVTTAVAYLWSLGASGWANAYYSAAVQAGTQSWKAMLFGSFDASNAITVDKPPAALWVMEISARLFGVNSWSILVPEALMGVATVALVVLLVRRWFSSGAALFAGLVVASTPVAALMFRFNNPDALLVLALTAGAYALTRALESGRTRWMVAAGGLVGLGFLAKMMQAFVVIPAFALVYLIAGPPRLRRRLQQIVVMGLATIAAGGWWVALVELWPSASRPYIGGSQGNSVLELMFGYNGLGRLTGNETGSVGGAGNGSGRWGATGLLRLFTSDYGGQISWLLPAALLVVVAGLVATWRRPRTDRTRAALVLWGATLLLTGLTISLSKGIIHTYYTVALAPAVGMLLGIGVHLAWTHRDRFVARAVTAAGVLASAGWAYVLLDRSPSWHPWLRVVVAVSGVVAAGLLLLGGRRRAMMLAAAGVGAVTLLAGPVAYTLNTVQTAHTGSLPTAGPRVSSGFGPGQGGPGGAGGDGTGARPTMNGGTRPTMNGGSPPSMNGGTGTNAQGTGATGTNAQGTGATGGMAGGAGGGAGGLLNASTPSAEVVTALQADADGYDWVLATVGANSAAGYQLASGEPVMAIGGFNGSDASPTLAQFQAYVAAGRIHYFVGGGNFGGQSSGSNAGTEIATWVQEHYTSVTIGGTTFYDLTQPLA